MRFRHVLVTMFNRRLDRGRATFGAFDERDDDWARYRWRLFTRYTVPSVAAQSESDFSWIVLCHPDSPDWLKVGAADVTMRADVHFSFLDQDPALDRFADGSADALLVTRIDSDDGWHRRAMERIREDCEADPYTSEVVLLTDGYLLDHDARRMRPYHHPSPAFCTKINLAPDLNPLDLGGDHSRLRRRYPARSISDGDPKFVVVTHGERHAARACDPADPRWLTSAVTGEILHRDFGVALADDDHGQTADPVGRARPPRARPAAGPPRRAQPAAVPRQRVVVSVPCCQSWESAARTVESLLTQTYSDLLVIATNDGDPDPDWDMLSHLDDPRLIRVDHAANRGRYFVDQVALMARLGPYLLVQDPGGWSEPDRVQALLEQTRTRHGAAAVSAHYQHGSGPPGSMAVVGPGDTDAPVTAVYRSGPGQPSWYHALFDSRRLLNVGGCYGGYRLGYDAFLFYLLRMTGAVTALHQPLYHRPEAGRPAASGLGPASPDAASGELAGLSGEAYHVYCEYLQGNIGFSLLCQQLRFLAWRHVSTSEWAALRDEAHRLRWIVQQKVSGRS